MTPNDTCEAQPTLGKWHQVCFHLTKAQIRLAALELPGAVLLDGKTGERDHSHLIFSALPSRTFTDTAKISSIDPDSRLNQYSVPPNIKQLPFISGYIGYLSYNQNSKPPCPADLNEPDLPCCQISYFDWSYVTDLKTNESWLSFSPSTPISTYDSVRKLFNRLNKQQTETPPRPDLTWHPSQTKECYQKAFARLHEYILAGDVYQANLTQRFESTIDVPVEDLYFSTQPSTPAGYCSLFKVNEKQHILSFSPEQFIQIEGSRISSKPIKGTISANIPNAESILKNSTKDRAENLMIVDLLRNDLSKVSELKSVRVPALFDIERHRDVLHLVSTIEGTLRKDVTPLQAMIACFPGGSITGAPKRRAMEIIEELEAHPRSAYCGTIFYWSDQGKFDSNILIRTIVHDHGKLYCLGGGGIVADSDCESEYRESLLKVEHLTGISAP